MDRALKISQSNKQKSKNKICAREASQFQLAGTHAWPWVPRLPKRNPQAACDLPGKTTRATKIQCPPGNMLQALNIYCNMLS